MGRKPIPLAYRIDENGCHICTSHKPHVRDRYTQVNRGGKVQYMHRYLWEQINGKIPDGMYVLHKCNNRACINPEHLYLGTHAQNMRDVAKSGVRQVIPDKVIELIIELRSVMPTRKIARIYDVSQSTVSKLHNGTYNRLCQDT